ncbi:elongator complex protein 4 [Sarcoptes scabiei]|nr:elongator complex protein 4 [Sarcoptes scabiei]
MEKFLIVRNLIYELLELLSILNKDLAPSLWRKRNSQLLKINSDPKDPFAKLYLGEEEESEDLKILDKHFNCNDGNNDEVKSAHSQEQSSASFFDSSLEEFYERILTKLNQGNQHLNLDIMPSFTYGNLQYQSTTDLTNTIKQSIKSINLEIQSEPYCSNTHHRYPSRIKKRSKFSPFYVRNNCKYMPLILDYYNQINDGFNRKFKSNIQTEIVAGQSINNNASNNLHRHSFSSFSNSLIGPTVLSSPTLPTNNSNNSTVRKFRRHLLLSIREANFSQLFQSNCNDLNQLQIDFYIIRCNDSVPSSCSSTSSTSTNDIVPYEVLTEKYCYPIFLNATNQTNKHKNINRALFLDVLAKKSPQNGLSNNHHYKPSQHSDASNYYLIVQVWRYGKILLSESRTKTMLSAASGSLTNGSSVFHTISTGSLSSAAVAATSNSLSSITSFVSNSSLFNSSLVSQEKSNSSSTPDSSSIDSSEYGNTFFKRSVGFALIPLLELVSRDKEIHPSTELFQNENFLSKIIFSDESMLLPVNVKLYDGDLTLSTLEMMLKHRQALNVTSLSNVSNAPTSSPISKLSLLPNNFQLIVCAKFISELISPQRFANNSRQTSNTISIQSLPKKPLPIIQSLSLADHLLVNRSPLVDENFVLIQKRCFGDLLTAGYFRNDLYLTLESAEFEKGGKTIPKNIEVSVCLITENGIQERAITTGINADPVTIYRSHIQYHQNSPKWFEHIKINVPLEQFETAHLRFVFCHCSSKERERKFLGFSFLPLADQNGACLADGEHELQIYKCDSERKLDDVSFYINIPWSHQGSESKSSSSLSKESAHNSMSSLNCASSISLTTTSTLINSRSPKEVFHLKTNLISSKLTQNSDILALLKWSCTPIEKVIESLRRISRVPGEEMVKFLEDILDALVIVDFFKTLNEPKFVSYSSTLEKYIEKQFSAPLVYNGLIECLKKYVEIVILAVEKQSEASGSISGVTKRELEFILRCLSVFDWLLKVIVQSRLLYTRASISGNLILEPIDSDGLVKIQSNDEFKQEMLSLFSSITKLLSIECKSSDDYLIVAIQESVLNSLPNAFNYLQQILNPVEIAKLVNLLVNLNCTLNNPRLSTGSNCFSPLSSSSSSITPTNSTPTTISGSGKKTIINAKLAFLQRTIQFYPIWSDEEARIELMDTFIRIMNICIGESTYCAQILRDIVLYLLDKTDFDLATVRPKRSCFSLAQEREIEMLSFGAIEAIVEHIIEITGGVPTSFDLFTTTATPILKLNQSNQTMTLNEIDHLGTMIVCLMVLLDFMSLKHYERLFEKRSLIQSKELVLNIFAVFLNALYYFPDNWLETKMSINRIMLYSLTMLRTIMSKKFLSPERFDETIWRMYFKLAVAFLTQQRLQLDSLPFGKRQFLIEVYGCDMRTLMGFELITCWDLLGAFKTSFIPNLVSSFVDVTLVPELELRKATIPIFYDMMIVDHSINGNFKKVEAALIDKLDVVAHKSECDDQFKELFAEILSDKIETSKPVWSQEGIKFVKSISNLLSLLIDYRQELKRKLFKAANICEIDDRLMISTYTLLKFFRFDIDSLNRKTIMLRYLEKLANVHTLLGNYAEAAFTLKLQADQLSWSSPNEAQRKESLCHTMLNYFEKGQCWEEGIKVCKELQAVYESGFKYSKLSALLKRNAQLLDKIITQHRPDNEYFRVSFYGLDFPSFLQNTTFIFRGLEFEKLSSFTHRIQQEFPSAQLLTKVVPSDENITESNCQYIQIFSVRPVPEPPVHPDQALIFGPPDNVLNYYNTNAVKQFVQDRPIQRGAFDPNNEFKSLWIERTTYTIEQSLPGMLRMFKVISTLVTYLSPIENACETIDNKNIELSKLISSYVNESSRPESISPLSMRLQGILDAAVNGGIAKYIDAFLGSEFLNTNPDQTSNVSLLKDRIAHQISIVEAGLSLHGRLAPTAVRPLHTRLLERFSIMRNTVNQANIELTQAMLWLPSNNLNHNHHRPSILSQPLPPIPNRNDHQSDSDTSSLSSNSSLHNNTCTAHIDRTPPPSQPPPPPPSLSVNNFQSPSGKSLKNKPLPPLPPVSSDKNYNSNSIKRHHSNIEQRSKHRIEETIYSVPQYTDLDLNNFPDNESSVDDSIEYCDIDSNEPINNQETNSNRINRSFSIPGSAMMNGMMRTDLSDNTPDTLKESLAIDVCDAVNDFNIPPPPLPPRSSNLDRSNSLNSGSILRQLSTGIASPPIPPQRPIKKTVSVIEEPFLNDSPSSVATSTFIDLDGLEFENLVLSSPTPSKISTSRPAPIIGIEINNNTQTTLEERKFDETTQTLANPKKLIVNDANLVPAEHRQKSSSLPRSLQSQLNSVNGNLKCNFEFDKHSSQNTLNFLIGPGSNVLTTNPTLDSLISTSTTNSSSLSTSTIIKNPNNCDLSSSLFD